MRAVLRLVTVSGLLASSAACSWFASWSDPSVTTDGAPTEAPRPTCRPAELDARGTPPWKVGETTPAGYAVAEVDVANPEYVRVAFTKGADKFILEVGVADAGAGDWSTDKYKLMPGPEQPVAPPEDLLLETMATLRTYSAAETGPAIAKKVKDVEDPYAGLPACP